MIKVLSLALLAALGLTMTSCLDDDTDDTTTATLSTYNLVDDGSGTLALTQSTNTYEINYSRGLFTATVSRAQIAEGVQASFTTGELTMSSGTDAYVFSSSALTGGVSGFNGKYDPNYGVIYLDYTYNGEYHVYSLLSFAYYFATMNVTDTETGEITYTTDDIAFGFTPVVDEEKCTFALAGFKTSENGSEISTLTYNASDDVDITYAMSGGGFIVSMTGSASPTEGYTQYDVTNLTGTVSNYGLNAVVSFDIGDSYHVDITGALFYGNK